MTNQNLKVPGTGAWHLLLFLLSTQLVFAQTTISPAALSSVPEIIQKIESRREGWIVLKADLTLHFLTSDHQTATCRGELLYDRLNEKILLTGFNSKEELLFIFKTSDRHFELYLPDQKTLFRGNIFELEDSPDLESHLKPLDIYRALKPMALPLENTKIEYWNKEGVALRVYGENRGRPYLARRLSATEEGDAQLETYYSIEERPMLTIRRLDFKTFRIPGSEKRRSISFPRRIKIENPGISKKGLERKPCETVLLFDKIDFYDSISEAEWLISLPQNTRISMLPD